MIAANSRFDAPSANSDRSSRSRDTVGSPASIFATRDWLDLIDLAISTWVNPRACRRAFRPSARRRRSSIYAASPSDSPRKSLAVPTFQPLASSFLRLLSCIVILLQAPTTRVNYALWGCGGFLRKMLREPRLRHHRSCRSFSSCYHRQEHAAHDSACQYWAFVSIAAFQETHRAAVAAKGSPLQVLRP
jgi:hypothetical protein